MNGVLRSTFNNWDDCPFNTLEEATKKSENLLEEMLNFYSGEFKTYSSETTLMHYIKKTKIAETSKDSRYSRGRRNQECAEISFELRLDNSFRELFNSYDNNLFDTEQELYEELESLKQAFLDYFS